MNNRRFWFFGRFLVFGIAFLFVGSLLVMLLWNAIIPVVIQGVKALTYTQALGIFLLSKLLFGGFRGGLPGPFGRRGGRCRDERMSRFINMTDEERAKFRAEWKDRWDKR